MQVFRLGTITLPGLAFQNRGVRPARGQRVPQVQLEVVPVLTPADSNAELRPVRGPIGAPWWERVPWVWCSAGSRSSRLIILGVVARRGRRAPPAVAASALDPARQALERLDALRRRRLPERGAFADHAFELTSIVRRFLEATAQTTRPGDTTTELLRQLETATLPPEDSGLLVELLRAGIA